MEGGVPWRTSCRHRKERRVFKLNQHWVSCTHHTQLFPANYGNSQVSCLLPSPFFHRRRFSLSLVDTFFFHRATFSQRTNSPFLNKQILIDQKHFFVHQTLFLSKFASKRSSSSIENTFLFHRKQTSESCCRKACSTTREPKRWPGRTTLKKALLSR